MKFPKSIPVMGKIYKIIEVTEFHAAAEIDEVAATITIHNDGTQDANNLLHTFCHELGHALFRRTGVTQGLSTEMEESIVDQYATLFTELFTMTLKIQKRTRKKP